MFSYDCMQARGTPIGVCMEGIYVGSCCRLTVQSPVHSPPTNSTIIQAPVVIIDGQSAVPDEKPATATTLENRSTTKLDTETTLTPVSTTWPPTSSTNSTKWQSLFEPPTQLSLETVTVEADEVVANPTENSFIEKVSAANAQTATVRSDDTTVGSDQQETVGVDKYSSWQSTESTTQEPVTEEANEVLYIKPVENSMTEKVSAASSHQTTTVRIENNTIDSDPKEHQATSSMPSTPPSTTASVTDWPVTSVTSVNTSSTHVPADVPQKLSTTSTQKDTSTPSSTIPTTETPAPQPTTRQSLPSSSHPANWQSSSPSESSTQSMEAVLSSHNDSENAIPTESPQEDTADTVVKVPTVRPDDKRNCGVRPLRPRARVVGGRNAHFGEWPW